MPTDNYSTKWLAVATYLTTNLATITDVKGVVQGDLALDSALSANKDCIAYFTIQDIPLISGAPGIQWALKGAGYFTTRVRIGIAVGSTASDGDLLDKMKIRLFDWLKDEWEGGADFGLSLGWEPVSTSLGIQRMGDYQVVYYDILIRYN